MMKTITQVANEIGVRFWRIRHALDCGYVEKPTMFSGRFIFTDEDVENLRTYFSRKEESNDPKSNRAIRE